MPEIYLRKAKGDLTRTAMASGRKRREFSRHFLEKGRKRSCRSDNQWLNRSCMGGQVLSASALIREAAKNGVRIGLDGDELALKAQVKPPDALIARLKASKHEIVTLLRQASTPGTKGP